jgi:2'-5' RNA ligase
MWRGIQGANRAMQAKTRYFFAAFPSPSERDMTLACANELQQRLALDGSRVLKGRINLTLYFIGAYDTPCAKAIAAAETAGDEIAWLATPVTLDKATRFAGDYGKSAQRRPAMFVPATLAQPLQNELNAIDQAMASVPRSGARALPPHVTFMYTENAKLDEPQAIAPMTWVIEEVCLVASVEGSGEYTVLKKWPCAKPA